MRVVRAVAAMAAATTLWAGPAISAQRWTAVSAGFRVTMSDEDIVVTHAGKRVFSVRESARADHRQLVKDAEGAAVRSERKFTLLSVAGPYLSLRDESFIDVTPSLHPGGETRFWTIDLRRASRPAAGGTMAQRAVDLSALVGSGPLVRALAADPFVRKAATGNIATLGAIRDTLAAGASANSRQCYDVPEDWTSRFAIRRWDGTRLLVWLGLPGSGPCRYRLTQLGVSVATSQALHKGIGPVSIPPAAKAVVITFGPRIPK